MKPDFTVVREFEKQVAEFFGAPFAVAVDSCTHGIELCLRYLKETHICCPSRTYLSVPMLANKLGLHLTFNDREWTDYYWLTNYIVDAAVLWKKNAYAEMAASTTTSNYLCLSFQYQKHLSLGRGGMILCPDEASAKQLRKLAYDGREPGVPWRDQNIDTMGYHYYMTPDTALEGLRKLPEAIATEPRQWTVNDWPDLTKMDVFKNTL